MLLIWLNINKHRDLPFKHYVTRIYLFDCRFVNHHKIVIAFMCINTTIH
jgi:hypothetical protein